MNSFFSFFYYYFYFYFFYYTVSRDFTGSHWQDVHGSWWSNCRSPLESHGSSPSSSPGGRLAWSRSYFPPPVGARRRGRSTRGTVGTCSFPLVHS